MNKRNCAQRLLIAPALMMGMVFSGNLLFAQQSSAPPQRPNQPAQQAPDTQADPQQPQGQIFAGTVKKTGDKYILQDASGTSYDVDRQDLIKKYDGQKVRINGALDPDGKTIHVK
jgi:hypothetical protein